MKRKKNPFGNYMKDYQNDPQSYRMSYDEWIKKNPYESDDCERCGRQKEGPFYRCPNCHI